MHINKKVIEEIFKHALKTYPDECCGIVTGDKHNQSNLSRYLRLSLLNKILYLYKNKVLFIAVPLKALYVIKLSTSDWNHYMHGIWKFRFPKYGLCLHIRHWKIGFMVCMGVIKGDNLFTLPFCRRNDFLSFTSAKGQGKEVIPFYCCPT